MIRLELMKKEDLTYIVKWNANTSPEFLMQWAGPYMNYPLTEEQLLSYMDQHKINSEGTDTHFYKIVDDSGLMLGCIELGKIDPVNQSARIGKVLVGNTESRGSRIGRQAVQKVLQGGFEKLKLHRISLGVFDFNESAIRCYKNCGFEIDGIMKESRKIGDVYWNLIEMSLLESKWRALQHRQEEVKREVKPGVRYKHFKGKEYEVLYVGKHSETMEEMVVYRQLYGECGIWVRPVEMFLEKVQVEGKWVNRFEEME